jgi:hypothetical protein
VEVFAAVTLAALFVKVTSFLKYVSAGEYRAAITQTIPWLAGIIGIWIVGHASVTEAAPLWSGGTPVGEYDFWSVVLVGAALGSDGSLAYDFKKALDTHDSAAEPALGWLPEPPSEPTEPVDGSAAPPPPGDPS